MSIDISEIEPVPMSVYDRVIRELNSGYQSQTTAAMKEITGVVLGSAASNPAKEEIVARIAVSAENQSPGYDTGSTQAVFDIGLPDLRRLAEAAPRYRAEFASIAQKVAGQLERDVAAYQRDVADWCDQGLPTKRPTALMRPLQLKPGH